MNAKAVSKSAGLAHVALWDNGAVLSDPKCHEIDGVLYAYEVGNLQTCDTSARMSVTLLVSRIRAIGIPSAQ